MSVEMETAAVQTGLSIHTEALPEINYALFRNHIPPVRRVVIDNRTAEDVRDAIAHGASLITANEIEPLLSVLKGE